MRSDPVEHFVTVFDANFLPMGMALHDSLERHHGNFHLWILCMDEKVGDRIRSLGLANVSLLELNEMETPELLEAKGNRTRQEYCWTLTSFTFAAVFARDPSIARVTYVDADVFFYENPSRLIAELDQTGKHVLYTDHAYEPRYDQSAVSGKYCVQFLTARNTPEAARVMDWWREKCLEWCYDRPEPGRYGDQKYLEQWETLFPGETHVLRQTPETLGPWNVESFFRAYHGYYRPVLYHFHSLRIVAPDRVRLYLHYPLGTRARPLYAEYVTALRKALARMKGIGISTPYLPQPPLPKERRSLRQRLRDLLSPPVERYEAL